MTLQLIKDELPDYAKDVRLNLGSVLTPEGAPGLTEGQIFSVALASAYATRSQELIDALLVDSTGIVTGAEVNAAKAAATIMAMNNIYYRFLHLATNKEYSKMPAKLRMNIIASPGVEKVDFELYSLAVSAINGCGMCMDSHVSSLEKLGTSQEAIQSAVRIASVINSAAQALALK